MYCIAATYIVLMSAILFKFEKHEIFDINNIQYAKMQELSVRQITKFQQKVAQRVKELDTQIDKSSKNQNQRFEDEFFSIFAKAIKLACEETREKKIHMLLQIMRTIKNYYFVFPKTYNGIKYTCIDYTRSLKAIRKVRYYYYRFLLYHTNNIKTTILKIMIIKRYFSAKKCNRAPETLDDPHERHLGRLYKILIELLINCQEALRLLDIPVKTGVTWPVFQ